jgi:hypothetical protein
VLTFVRPQIAGVEYRMFDEDMINGEVLQRYFDQKASGVHFKIRLPWYRSLPLSCVERLDVSIDGEAATRSDISLSIHGQEHTLQELLDLPDVWWFVLDTAEVRVCTRKVLAQGDHRIHVALGCRIPYGLTKDWDFKQIAHCEKSLTLVGGDY